jgi:hypothetical protein
VGLAFLALMSSTTAQGDLAARRCGESDAACSKPSAAAAPGRAYLEALIDRIAIRHGLDCALVRAVVAAESGYDSQALSRAGARGLMQVMPATAADYGVKHADALFDPETNIDTGARHLKRLLDKYGNDYGRAIMAYNAGEGVVDRTDSNVTYAETLNYSEAVIGYYERNGGVKRMDGALRKVRALRRMGSSPPARRSLEAYLDPSAGRNPVNPRVAVSRLDSSLYPELADDDLDRALAAQALGGGSDDLPRGDL